MCAAELVDFCIVNERKNRACAAGMVDFQNGSEPLNRVSVFDFFRIVISARIALVRLKWLFSFRK